MESAPKRARTELASSAAAPSSAQAEVAEAAVPADAPPPAPAPAPAGVASWVGEWHVLGSAKCYANECADPNHAPAATFSIAALDGDDALLTCTAFCFDQLVDPYGGEPFEDYTSVGTYFSATDASAQLDFSATGGCGIEDVSVSLELTPKDGRMPTTAELRWSVKLGYLYKKMGHRSWKGSQEVWLRKAPPATS